MSLLRNKEENLTTVLNNQESMRLTKNIKISAKLHNEIIAIKQELSDEEDRHTTVDDTLRLAVACLKREREKR